MTTEPDPTPVTRPAPTGYRYAGAWIRLFALIIDGLLLFAIVYVLFIVLGGVLYLAYPQAPVRSSRTSTPIPGPQVCWPTSSSAW